MSPLSQMLWVSIRIGSASALIDIQNIRFFEEFYEELTVIKLKHYCYLGFCQTFVSMKTYTYWKEYLFPLFLVFYVHENIEFYLV